MKRTLKDEKRSYKVSWEFEFFITSAPNNCMVCLICQEVLKTLKSYNAKQHYQKHKTHSFSKLEGERRIRCINELKEKLIKQQSRMAGFIKTHNTLTEASYRIAYHLGQSGKPYSDGEIIKACIIDAVKCIHPGKEKEYNNIPLSRNTIQRRQEAIARNLKENFIEKINQDNTLFSIAIDESTDNSDHAQLMIFIRRLSVDFEISEDILSIETLPMQTRGEDIFSVVKNACSKYNLNLKNLKGLCTDGAPAMTGIKNGFTTRFKEYLIQEYNNNNCIALHCIIHQEVLCAKIIDISDISREVQRIILYIRSSALTHRQFRELLENSENFTEHDVLYHSSVRWLSQGKTALRIFELRNEVIEFYKKKNKETLLSKKDFLVKLAFFVDILSYINTLNLSLQGKSSNVCHLHKKIREFSDKCFFLKRQLQHKEYRHFTQLSLLIEKNEIMREDVPSEVFLDVFDVLKNEFSNRFQDFEKISTKIQLVSFPHVLKIEDSPFEFQMELISLQSNDHIVKKFENGTDLVEIWKSAFEYPRLQELARDILVLYGSTYVCEAAFSNMNYIKNKFRTRLTNKSLEAGVRLMVSTLEPDFKQLASDNQEQGSH